jgi:hypothetical protein
MHLLLFSTEDIRKITKDSPKGSALLILSPPFHITLSQPDPHPCLTTFFHKIHFNAIFTSPSWSLDDYFPTGFPPQFHILKYIHNTTEIWYSCFCALCHARRTGGKTPHTPSTRWGWAVNVNPFTYLSGKSFASTGYVAWVCRDIPEMVVKSKSSNVPATEFKYSHWVFH